MERFTPEWFAEKAKEQKYVDLQKKCSQLAADFKSKYGIERLKVLSGKELLEKMFYNDTDRKENLCWMLELNPDMRANFGSIAGGAAYKFGLFYHKSSSCWMSGSPMNPKSLTDDEALKLGTEFRDQLVAGAEIIRDTPMPQSIADYEQLEKQISAHIQLNSIWVLKYYKMLFPELFFAAYAVSQQKHVLYTLQLTPDDTQFTRMGQLALYAQKCGISVDVMKQIIQDEIGWYKPVYRIGTGDDSSQFDIWKAQDYCALGFSEIGDYSVYCDKQGKPDKEKLAGALTEQYAWPKSTASRKAKEISNFIEAENDETIVVAMCGQQLLGIGFVTGSVYFEQSDDGFNNRRKVRWAYIPTEKAALPVFEGRQTSFYPLDDDQNLAFIYKALYRSDMPQTDEDRNRTGFIAWLKEQVIPEPDSRAGQKYKESTINSYVQALSFVKVRKNGKSCSVFALTDTEEIKAINAHDYVKTAANKYIQYLTKDIPDGTKHIHFATGYTSACSRNRIVFGAPGTGKSFKLNSEKDTLLASGGAYERVTFHPDYSYANFVGTYKPVPCVDENGHNSITYKYVPGPFMRMYVQALRNSREDAAKPFLLLIEEINRANVAAVFGDVFQLLDRADDDTSEYPIQASEDMQRYLADELGGEPSEFTEIRLPDNFFIWATMNSADQGVFPMDTAFKRRWDFEYLNINAGESGIAGKTVTLGTGDYKRTVEWNQLRRAINDRLSSFRINEDKLLGPYFLSRRVIPANGDIDPDVFAAAFRNKVLMYLFDDAAKQKRSGLFANGVDTSKFSAVCDVFDEKGVFVFCTEISDRFPAGDGK